MRELERLLWTSVRESAGSRLEPPRTLAGAVRAANGLSDGQPAVPSVVAANPGSLDPLRIQFCLDEHGGSIEATWRALNLTSRHVLVRLIKEHGLRTR